MKDTREYLQQLDIKPDQNVAVRTWENGIQLTSLSKLIEGYETEQLILHGVTKRNWFQRMPLHWRFIYYLIGGIIIGLLLPYVW